MPVYEYETARVVRTKYPRAASIGKSLAVSAHTWGSQPPDCQRSISTAVPEPPVVFSEAQRVVAVMGGWGEMPRATRFHPACSDRVRDALGVDVAVLVGVLDAVEVDEGVAVDEAVAVGVGTAITLVVMCELPEAG